MDNSDTINFLHLADLHFGNEKEAKIWFGQLTDDLWDRHNVKKPDIVIFRKRSSTLRGLNG